MRCDQVFRHQTWKSQVFEFFVSQAKSSALLLKIERIQNLLLFGFGDDVPVCLCYSNHFLLFFWHVLKTIKAVVLFTIFHYILSFLLYLRQFEWRLMFGTGDACYLIIVEVLIFDKWTITLCIKSIIELLKLLHIFANFTRILRWLDSIMTFRFAFIIWWFQFRKVFLTFLNISLCTNCLFKFVGWVFILFIDQSGL